MLKKLRQSQTPTKNPQYFANKLGVIYTAVHDLLEKEVIDEKDFYVALELAQRYIEILDDIAENIHIQPIQPLEIQFQEHTIRFPSEEEFSSWLEL